VVPIGPGVFHFCFLWASLSDFIAVRSLPKHHLRQLKKSRCAVLSEQPPTSLLLSSIPPSSIDLVPSSESQSIRTTMATEDG
jgi:hypothetical protein